MLSASKTIVAESWLGGCAVVSAKEAVFRLRDKIGIVFFLVVLLSVAHNGRTLGLREPAEDWLDVLGCVIVASGHGLRILALRHIGPISRTHVLKAPQLVTQGPYAVVRNPLYLGNWLIATGLCLIAQLRWLLLLGPLAAFLLYYVTALAEESTLLDLFGEHYRRYCQAVPRFFPRSLFTAIGWRRLFDGRGTKVVLWTKEYQAFLTSGICIFLLELFERLH